MAFRKFRKKTMRRRRGPPLARVRRTWVTCFRENWCDPVVLDLDACNPETPSQSENDLWMVLLDSANLEALFSDRARVARIVGDVWWYGEFQTPPQDPAARLVADIAIDTWQGFIGLKKDQVTGTQAPGVGMSYKPLVDDFDFSEAQWLKTWQRAHRAYVAQQENIAQLSNLSFPYSDVHTYVVPGTPSCNDLAEGTGTICIETEPTCVTCENPDIESTGVESRYPILHHFHIDHKRGIRLRENEQLLLQFGYVFPQLGTLSANVPQFKFFGGIKALIET